MKIFVFLVVFVPAALVAAEFVLRWWFKTHGQIRIRTPHENFELTCDPAIIPGLSPKSRFITNAHGARGKPIPREGKTLKILAIGGSGVECFLLDEDECWTAIIEQRLNEPSALKQLGVDAVRVWNTGKSGVTPATLAYALPNELGRMPRFDLVLIMNDISVLNEWLELGLPEQFPDPGPSWDDLFWHRNLAFGWSPKRTGFAELVRRIKDRWSPRRKLLTGLGRGLAKSREQRATCAGLQDVLPSATVCSMHYKAALTRVVEIIQGMGSRCLVIHQPIFSKLNATPEELALFWHGGIGSTAKGKDRPFLSHRAFVQALTLLGRTTKQVAINTGAAYTDPVGAVPSDAEHYYDHIHFKPKGAVKLGEFLADRVFELCAEREPCEPQRIAGT